MILRPSYRGLLQDILNSKAFAMIEFSRLPIDHKIHIIIVSIIYLVIGIMETEVTVIDPPVDTLQSRGHLLSDLIQESIILV